MSSAFSITINEELYTINLATDPIRPDTTLSEFLRSRTRFKATKEACEQGGCGACTVAWTYFDPIQEKTVTRSLNSCLALLLSLDGTKITTNDNPQKNSTITGLQKILYEKSGTQCGYCANGFVMNMYAFLQEYPQPSALDVELAWDGNICRCTGYRPILDAFKTYAKDSCIGKGCHHQGEALLDIEDVDKRSTEKKSRSSKKLVSHPLRKGETTSNTFIWQDITSTQELSFYMQSYSGLRVMLTVGGTSRGIYEKNYDVYLFTGTIPDFQLITQDASTGIKVGAAVTIKQLINYLGSCKATYPYQIAHFPQAMNHLYRVGGNGIRARGSVVGNIMITYDHQKPTDYFPSDVCIILMGLEATVQVTSCSTMKTTSYSMSDFFALDLGTAQCFINSVTIPWGKPKEIFKTYKIAVRAQMAHSLVNAAMKVTITTDKNGKTVISGETQPVVAFGGIFASITRVGAVEKSIIGLDVTSTPSFQFAAASLKGILSKNVVSGEGREAFRVQTAVNYFYKFFLALQPSLPASLDRAAKVWMTRPVTQATQTFGTDPSEAPVSLPIPKIDGLQQTQGTAVYVDDIPLPQNCVFGALVQAQQACTPIVSIDPSVAYEIQGFVKYYDHTALSTDQNELSAVGPLFCTGTTAYAGQCIGLVVATSQKIARYCAELIQKTVKYGTASGVLTTIEEALKAGSFFPDSMNPTPISRGNAVEALKTCAHVVSGSVDINSQYHFHLENNAALVIPAEDGFVVHCSSQGPVLVQLQLSKSLGLPSSSFHVSTRRCGGALGAKGTNAMFVGAMAGIIAKDLGIPAKVILTFGDPIRGLGVRPLYQLNYIVGTDAQNKISAMKLSLYMACGANCSDVPAEVAKVISNIDNCYNVPNFYASVKQLKTSVPPPTSVRGPGWIQSILYSEMMMDSVAKSIGADPITFRENNFYAKGDTAPNGQPITGPYITNVWSTLLQSSDYKKRLTDVATFNAANKFVKRGMAASAARFSVDWVSANYNSLLAVYDDGSIGVSHGGVELGQGINTKVTQAIAFKLGFTEAEMPVIKILPSTTRVSSTPSNITGGSVASELCVCSVMNACDVLLERLNPFKKPGQSWKATVLKAADSGVNMTASGWSNVPASAPYSKYNSWGAAVSEVEIDALTGQSEVKRTDIVFDCGISMNPDVDIGQIEGGFVMGLGWFTQEIAPWDKNTGAATNDGTWQYKPPMTSNIPEVWNVTLLKNSQNPLGILSSKAVGEPPLSLASSVVLALENAINAARKECQLVPNWKCTAIPLSVDAVADACGVSTGVYVL